MKLKKENNRLLIDGSDDYIISKNTMFDLRECKNNITINNFSGSCGINNETLVYVAKWMDYSKFQVKCLKLLLRFFNKKFENEVNTYLIR